MGGPSVTDAAGECVAPSYSVLVAYCSCEWARWDWCYMVIGLESSKDGCDKYLLDIGVGVVALKVDKEIFA